MLKKKKNYKILKNKNQQNGKPNPKGRKSTKSRKIDL